MFEIYIIIFVALAIVIFLKLRSVLGQRTGRERPHHTYSARNAARGTTSDNDVVKLPASTESVSAAASMPLRAKTSCSMLTIS